MPYTPEFITELRQHLCLSDPLDAAVFACLVTCFYAAARVGEFVVPRLDAFSPTRHVTLANMRVDRNAEGLEVTVLHLPHTKAAPLEGEDVFWGSHPGPTDPYEALNIHLRVNNPPRDAPPLRISVQRSAPPPHQDGFRQTLGFSCSAGRQGTTSGAWCTNWRYSVLLASWHANRGDEGHGSLEQ